jgi:hypothetical protein
LGQRFLIYALARINVFIKVIYPAVVITAGCCGNYDFQQKKINATMTFTLRLAL